ncbi:MAG TPA: hypothetical protein DCE78_02345 [Bacteroidetes bacterium]|nr:hypothetical protein [Bacteroidota bacterium]
MSDNLNLTPIKALMDAINSQLGSNQKEVRITMERARQAEKSLSQLLLKLVELQDKIIKLQENSASGPVNIELKGDKF